VTFEGYFGDLLTVVTLCAQLTRDTLAIAKFLVAIGGIWRIDTKAELDCARETVSRQEAALVDKERDFCQKLQQTRAEDLSKIRQLSSEMYRFFALQFDRFYIL